MTSAEQLLPSRLGFDEKEESVIKDSSLSRTQTMIQRVYPALLALVFVFALIGIVVAAIALGLAADAFGHNKTQDDDIEHLETVIRRQKVPFIVDVAMALGWWPVPRHSYDKSDSVWAARDLRVTGFTEVHPEYDDNDVPVEGGLDILVDTRLHNGAYAYGPMTANCTNTEKTVPVWTYSGPISKGSVVGSYRGIGATNGFATYEYVILDADNSYSSSAALFALGNSSSLAIFLSAAREPRVASVYGTDIDRDGMTVALGGQAGAPYSTSAVSACLFSAVQHTDQEHFVFANPDPTGSNGGVTGLCFVNSLAPLALTCAAVPVTFAAGETVAITGVVHDAGSENFVVTYVSDTTGLNSMVVTVDRSLLTITASAPVVIDAAMNEPDCGLSKVTKSGSVLTYLYLDNSGGPFGLTAQRYTLTGTTLTNVAGPVLLDTDFSGVIFDAAALGSDHIVVAIAKRTGLTRYSELRLLSTIGTTAPTMPFRTSFIAPEGNIAVTNVAAPHVVALSDSAFVLTFTSDRREEHRSYSQVWHVHPSSTNNYLVPGQVQPMGIFASDVSVCTALAFGERAMCISSADSPHALTQELRVTKLAIMRDFTLDNGFALNTVFQTGDRPLGIALHAAMPGDSLTVRTSGCFEKTIDQIPPEGDDTVYQTNRPLCLHGDGSVRPDSMVLEGAKFDPHCVCVDSSRDSFECGTIGT